MAYRVKMDISNRAKQFAPFAALKGFEEALRLKEKITVEKVELTEEMMEEINSILLRIQLKDVVTVVYYDKEEYLQVTGMVSKIDKEAGNLYIVETRIAFDKIVKIEW